MFLYNDKVITNTTTTVSNLDSKFKEAYNNIINYINNTNEGFFRDIPPLIIIKLYNIIYSTNKKIFRTKKTIYTFIISNDKCHVIINDYMFSDVTRFSLQLIRTDSTVYHYTNQVSINKYKQFTNYIYSLNNIMEHMYN